MHSGGLAPSEYRKQIDSDLARRSSAGGFVYLGFLVALWATTDYFSRYPKTLATFSAFSAASAGLRFFLGRRFQQRYDRNPRAWRSAYFLSINLNILAWGALLAITFLLFGYGDWKTLLLLICLAGTAPVALASMSPDLLVLRVYLFALTLPMICANMYLGGIRGYGMAMVFCWYLLFALFHAHTLHRQCAQYIHERFALAAAKKSAEDANKAKAEFLAHMSHELKTPMNAIFGMTHLALNSPPGGDQRQYLELVKSSAETLLKMLNGLLDFSKIEAGKMELENIEFSTPELVDETLRSFSGELQRKGLTLEFHVDDDVPLRLRGDPLRLRQVLVNVVDNAVKFHERRRNRGTSIAARCRRRAGRSAVRGSRYRHRYPTREAPVHLRSVRTGRFRDHSGIRRERPRPGHLVPNPPADGRTDMGGKRAWAGKLILLDGQFRAAVAREIHAGAQPRESGGISRPSPYSCRRRP